MIGLFIYTEARQGFGEYLSCDWTGSSSLSTAVSHHEDLRQSYNNWLFQFLSAEGVSLICQLRLEYLESGFDYLNL